MLRLTFYAETELLVTEKGRLGCIVNFAWHLFTKKDDFMLHMNIRQEWLKI